MPKLVIIGAGGHAKVVLSALRALEQLGEVDFLLDDLKRGSLMGKPVEGGLELLDSIPRRRYDFHVAIGDNRTRARIINRLLDLGYSLRTIIHPSAVVETNSIDVGCYIAAKAFIGVDSKIGKGVIVNTGATVDHDCIIEDFVHIAPGSNLAGGVIIGQGTLIGIGTKVLPGVKIGNWSVIGAGSVVLRDIPSGVTAWGIPAELRYDK